MSMKWINLQKDLNAMQLTNSKFVTYIKHLLENIGYGCYLLFKSRLVWTTFQLFHV